MTRYPRGQKRLVFERFMLWLTRGAAGVTAVGVVWLNIEQGNTGILVLSLLGVTVALLIGLLDYKYCVGVETSDILSRSEEWQEHRAKTEEMT